MAHGDHFTRFKALTLWQPWASAVALGLKTIETRSWSTAYRGPLAIHAAKRWRPDQVKFYSQACADDRFPIDYPDPRNAFVMLPRGAIVATCELLEVRPIGDWRPSVKEICWGDYRRGRFAWMLGNIRALAKPVEIRRGRQTMFSVDLTREELRYT